MREHKPHWLPLPTTTGHPHRIITLDTETRWHEERDQTVHTLRCWVARVRELVTVDHELAGGHTASGVGKLELASQIDRWCYRDHTTWLFAHNLHFDLAVSDLVVQLCRRGWTLNDHALTNTTVWARFAHGRRRLTIADSHSWLPKPLATIARAFGQKKLPLPDNDAPLSEWLARCERDVDVLEQAMLQLIGWWKEGGYGQWGVTGTATGWTAARRRMSDKLVLIDPDPVRRGFERMAISGGRREVWRTGVLPRSRYVEIDLRLAHLTACEHFALPARPELQFASLEVDDDNLCTPYRGVIADCEVETPTPRYPLMEGDRVWFPTGRFRTILAGPELIEARRLGHLKRIGPGVRYRMQYHMQRWAQWCRDLIEGSAGPELPMVQLLAKQWSRTVPGKWAGHTSEVYDRRPGWCQTWSVERGRLHPGAHKCAVLQVGGQEWTLLTDLDADECFPAVLAWVQSWTRVACNRMVDWFGSELMIVCNTDAVIVRAARGPDLGRLSEHVAPFVPVVKSSWRDLEVLSPQHLITDGERRFAGVPDSAQPSSPTTLEWTVWPRLTRSIERGAQGDLRSSERQADFAAVPINRWLLKDGRTMPPAAAVAAPGSPQLLPPNGSLGPDPLAALGALQHPYLRNLLTTKANG